MIRTSLLKKRDCSPCTHTRIKISMPNKNFVKGLNFTFYLFYCLSTSHRTNSSSLEKVPTPANIFLTTLCCNRKASFFRLPKFVNILLNSTTSSFDNLALWFFNFNFFSYFIKCFFQLRHFKPMCLSLCC
jgi:hypothetical protein